MQDKGREFKGIIGGTGYDRLASLNGMKADFYRSAFGDLDLTGEIKILDLGCGTASMSIAAFEKTKGKAEIHGVDISQDQLGYARQKIEDLPGLFRFHQCSMDDLDFDNESFDIVMTCMALHETPPEVRRRAIRETGRILKNGGIFILVDWSKPRLGLYSILWFPFLFFGDWKDNWKNVYRELCSEQGLALEEDSYINSLARRQVFRKRSNTNIK